MKTIDPKVIRQLFALLLIVVMGGLIIWEMLPYLTGVLGAVTIYVLLRGWMSKLIKKGWNSDLAAIFLMLISFIGILVPVSGIVLLLGNKIGHAVRNGEHVVKVVKGQLADWGNRLGYDFASKIDVSGMTSWLSEKLQNFAGGTFNTFIAIAIMYFMLYYMFTNRRELKTSLYEYVPIEKNHLSTIGHEINAMVRSNALGIPLVAIAQGIVALIGFFIFGIEAPFFWFVIVAVGSMVPFLGALLGIIPVFILTLSSGSTFQAWGILLYGLIVVGSTDNIVRLYILRKLDDVHPLITLIGVIIGVPLFGFIGLIFGPLLISLFLVVLNIYKQQYGQ